MSSPPPPPFAPRPAPPLPPFAPPPAFFSCIAGGCSPEDVRTFSLVTGTAFMFVFIVWIHVRIHVRSRGKAEPSEKYGLLGNAQEEEVIVA